MLRSEERKSSDGSANIKLAKILSNFTYDLKIRNSNGHDYYHTYIKNPFVRKEIYVGKVKNNPNSRLQYYLNILIKEYKHTLIEISTRQYDLQELSRKEVLLIDLYRFLYYQSLTKYSKSDLSVLEENRYTKYVHGTTAVEGNTYNLLETDLTLNQGMTVGGKSAREFFEINNYRKLKNYISKFENRSITFDIDFIRKIHYFILNEINDENAGQFRGINVGIRGANFSPAQPFEIEDQLEALCQWYKSSSDKMHPIELIALFHHRFEQIHPFIDGNGRVGREIMRLQLHEFDLPSIFVNNENRSDYIKALNNADRGEIAELIRFIFKQVSHELADQVYSLYLELNDLVSSFPEDLFSNPDIDQSVDELMEQILLTNQNPEQIDQLLNNLD